MAGHVDRAHHAAPELPGGAVGVGERIGPLDVVVVAADLREHLAKLAAVHPEAHEVVMLRYYAGIGVEDVAAVLGVDRRTVTRRWTLAKAWLFERMNGRDEGSCTTTNDSPPPT
jgi:DNA-directed RNA polymerase specialized sigma24 family protein